MARVERPGKWNVGGELAGDVVLANRRNDHNKEMIALWNNLSIFQKKCAIAAMVSLVLSRNGAVSP